MRRETNMRAYRPSRYGLPFDVSEQARRLRQDCIRDYALRVQRGEPIFPPGSRRGEPTPSPEDAPVPEAV